MLQLKKKYFLNMQYFELCSLTYKALTTFKKLEFKN